MEKVLWLIERVKSGLQSFMLEVSPLDDAPWSGRPVEVDSDQIKTIIENSLRYTMQEMADTQNIHIKRWKSYAPALVMWITLMFWLHIS